MNCPNCGVQAPVPSGFCSHCGAPLGSPRTRPSGPSRSSGPKSWVWVVVAVAIGVALILPAAGLYFLERGVSPASPPPTVPLELQFLGPRCPGWSNESALIPFDGNTVSMSFTLHNQRSAGSCTAESVSMSTPGFTLLSYNTPLTVNAGMYGSLNVTTRTPSTMPIGVVTMIVTVVA